MNTDIVTRYYAAFNSRDFDAYAQLFGPEVEIEFPGVSARGLERMRGFDQAWVEAFPAARLECFRMTAAAGQVAAAIWFQGGPQRGAVGTPAGVIPARGKTFDCPGVALFSFEGERIVRQQILIEPGWITAQLGAPQ
jgi:steroid delta-isomerase-like uncharacterized protein